MTPPTPSKTETQKVSQAQEVAAKLYDECYEHFGNGETEQASSFDTNKAERIISEAIAPLERERDEEIGRWQDRIYQFCRKHAPHPDGIDGGGCDSGDELDFTLAEISQLAAQLEDRAETAEAQLSSLSLAVEQLLEALDTCKGIAAAIDKCRSLVVKSRNS